MISADAVIQPAEFNRNSMHFFFINVQNLKNKLMEEYRSAVFATTTKKPTILSFVGSRLQLINICYTERTKDKIREDTYTRTNQDWLISRSNRFHRRDNSYPKEFKYSFEYHYCLKYQGSTNDIRMKCIEMARFNNINDSPFMTVLYN